MGASSVPRPRRGSWGRPDRLASFGTLTGQRGDRGSLPPPSPFGVAAMDGKRAGHRNHCDLSCEPSAKQARPRSSAERKRDPLIFSRLNPKGIHPREVAGIRRIESELTASPFCSGWFGYTNLVVRKGVAGKERREIDLVLVTHDRVVMADLKDWGGRTTNSAGAWLHNGQRRGMSAVLKIEGNSHALINLLQTEAQSVAPRPYVEYFVVFTADDADISGLSANDLTNALRLPDFLAILTDPAAYVRRFGTSRAWSETKPLAGGSAAGALKALFREGGPFLAREASFAEYEPQGEPTHEHRGGIWQEYLAIHRTNSSSSGLLRLWDCEKLPTAFSAAEARRGLLVREQTVLSYLQNADPDFHADSTLTWRARDEDFGMRFWEVFELRRTARRLRAHMFASPGMPMERRLELAAILLAKSATLHRRRVAHRDLGEHSVWIEPEAGRIRFTAFGAAHFPDAATVADTRLALLAAGEPLPEDRGAAQAGTAFQQDVFLLGVLCWQVLVGSDVPRTSGVADPGASETLLQPPLDQWLRKAICREPAGRYADAVEMEQGVRRRHRPPHRRRACPGIGAIPIGRRPVFLVAIHRGLRRRLLSDGEGRAARPNGGMGSPVLGRCHEATLWIRPSVGHWGQGEAYSAVSSAMARRSRGGGRRRTRLPLRRGHAAPGVAARAARGQRIFVGGGAWRRQVAGCPGNHPEARSMGPRSGAQANRFRPVSSRPRAMLCGTFGRGGCFRIDRRHCRQRQNRHWTPRRGWSSARRQALDRRQPQTAGMRAERQRWTPHEPADVGGGCSMQMRCGRADGNGPTSTGSLTRRGCRCYLGPGASHYPQDDPRVQVQHHRRPAQPRSRCDPRARFDVARRGGHRPLAIGSGDRRRGPLGE